MVEQITLSGVVLSAMPISEYDKRLVILTKQRGKITAFVRGARKQHSAYLAGSQPMAFGEFTMYQGKNAYTITAIKVTRYFAQDMTDIEKMSYGMYFLELADYYGREGIEAGDILNLMYVSIKSLQGEQIPNRLIRVIYELRIMVINGEYPDLFSCGNCGSEERIDVFDCYGNSVLCSKCHSGDRGLIKIDASSLYTLQFIVTAPLTKLFTFTVKDDVLSTLEKIITPYLTRNVDKEFKSLEFLEITY